MKFVVNRVSLHSIHYGSVEGIEGLEVCMDDDFDRSIILKGYCRGHILHSNLFYLNAFTVAEVPDTEEGYYLL